MKVNNNDINILEAIEIANLDNVLLKRRKNEMLLSDYQVNVLKRNGLNYEKYGSIKELLFDIEECLVDDYDDELDLVGSQLAELSYYKDTKK